MSPLPPAPDGVALTSVVVPATVSRRYTWNSPLPRTGSRFFAQVMTAQYRPSGVFAAQPDPQSPPPPPAPAVTTTVVPTGGTSCAAMAPPAADSPTRTTPNDRARITDLPWRTGGSLPNAARAGDGLPLGARSAGDSDARPG